MQVFRQLARIDRWTALEVASAALLAGGIWAQWGAPWAAMALGGLGLAVASLRAWALTRARRTAAEEAE